MILNRPMSPVEQRGYRRIIQLKTRPSTGTHFVIVFFAKQRHRGSPRLRWHDCVITSSLQRISALTIASIAAMSSDHCGCEKSNRVRSWSLATLSELHVHPVQPKCRMEQMGCRMVERGRLRLGPSTRIYGVAHL